jgi:hypothetical protein
MSNIQELRNKDDTVNKDQNLNTNREYAGLKDTNLPPRKKSMFSIFRRSKTTDAEDNKGFINKQMPFYWPE